ncbi:alpha/beta fold hydrolase [Dietzia psychralcaliphila]|uniref:alpha/beta fold hydrolase n=1 Tax=Dietzia psychralcaliphila TaxID=139021 RepID=UPI000D49FC45|nr:alpha/beta hydrolase [Dietzia psychralcaliphila]PTM86893.1 pimeloyl-ACP methyl ester carboxylesterase [Dietzia psychralcaliphila]
MSGEDDSTGRRRSMPRLRLPRRPSRSNAGEPVEIRSPELVGGATRDADAVDEQIRAPGGLAAGLSALGAATIGSVGTLLPGRRAGDPWVGEDMWELGVDRGSMVAASDGVPLAVREAGPTDAPMTVVFAHGYTLSMDSWHFQRRHLQDRFGSEVRLVFYDQRGHGLSGKSSRDNSTIAQLASDLNSVISATAPTGPIVAIGHSMGGMSVLGYAVRHEEAVRERVLGVGLVATAMAELSESGLGAVLDSRAVSRFVGLAGRTPAVFTSSRKALGAIISPFIYGGSFGDPAKMSPTVARFVDKLIASTDVLTIANFFETLTRHDESAAMPVLRDVRTTVLCGDRDLLTPLDRSVDIAEELPDAEFVVVPGAGHMVMLEEPAHVSEVLGDLIADAIVEWRARTRGPAVDTGPAIKTGPAAGSGPSMGRSKAS